MNAQDYLVEDKSEEKSEKSEENVNDSLLPQHASLTTAPDLSTDLSTEVISGLSTTHTEPLPAAATLASETAKPTASTKSPTSSFFTVRTGSSKGEDDSLFGETKKQEVLFTSFSDLLQSEKHIPSATSVKESLEQEKVIQQASQQILSPNSEKDPAEEGKRLLDSLLSENKAIGLGVPMLSRESGRKRERVKLDLTEEKRQSITMLDDDEKEEVKKPIKKPKTKTAKKGRSRRS